MASEVNPASESKQVVVMDPKWPYEMMQSYYMSRSPWRLKPNVIMVRPPDMTVYLETNSYGFKGGDVDPDKRHVALWGDSVVFGIGTAWVGDVDRCFPGFQFLNGGLEGAPFENIMERASEANHMLKIDYNILFPGWHTRQRPEVFETLLESAIKTLPGPVLCTVPTSLNEEVVEVDLSPYFKDIKDVDMFDNRDMVYLYWGSDQYSIDAAKKLLFEINRLNEIVRRKAKEKEVPLLDLFEHFRTTNISDFRDHFFDAGHPRPEAYREWQNFLCEMLKNVIV